MVKQQAGALMKLFKFKPLTNFEFVSNIIRHKRFYTANFFDLNDLMEGQFEHDPNSSQIYIYFYHFTKRVI